MVVVHSILLAVALQIEHLTEIQEKAKGWVLALAASMMHEVRWETGNGHEIQSKDFIGRA